MIHMPDGAAVVVSQPSPRDPSAPVIVTCMCACGDADCAFSYADGYRWVWSKWEGGLPSYATPRDGWIDDTDPRYAEVW